MVSHLYVLTLTSKCLWLLPGCYTWARFPVDLRCCCWLFSRAPMRLAPVTRAADSHVPAQLALETQAANFPVYARDSRAQHPPGVSHYASPQSPLLSFPLRCWVGSCSDLPCPGVVSGSVARLRQTAPAPKIARAFRPASISLPAALLWFLLCCRSVPRLHSAARGSFPRALPANATAPVARLTTVTGSLLFQL